MREAYIFASIQISMELKQLHNDLWIILSHWLDTSDLLALSGAESAIKLLLDYQPLWLQRAKLCGIYRPEFDDFDCDTIKGQLVAQVKSLYRHIRGIYPIEYARLITYIVIEDNAHELERLVLPAENKPVTALMPIAMQFGRVRIMHSLFNHFKVAGNFKWLILAIHNEFYAAVKYCVEILRVPLITDQPYQMFPTVNERWDPTFVMVTASGRRPRATFLHYNELLLREIIRCRDPKIVTYLKKKLDELQVDQAIVHPEEYLYAKIKRHSLESAPLIERCDSPDLESLEQIEP